MNKFYLTDARGKLIVGPTGSPCEYESKADAFDAAMRKTEVCNIVQLDVVTQLTFNLAKA